MGKEAEEQERRGEGIKEKEKIIVKEAARAASQLQYGTVYCTTQYVNNRGGFLPPFVWAPHFCYYFRRGAH